MARCEDYPCCGHELGDCDGSLYGSDESIVERVEQEWDDGHGYCDHANGIFQCAYDATDDDELDEDDEPDEPDEDNYRDYPEWNTERFNPELIVRWKW